MKTTPSSRVRRPLQRVWPGLGWGVILLSATGCAGFPQIGTGAHRPTPAEVRAAIQKSEHYVYFPGYEIYQHPTRGTYVYLTDQGWVERAAPPPEVDLEAMLASPRVETDFQDSPASHHARMIQAYPRTRESR